MPARRIYTIKDNLMPHLLAADKSGKKLVQFRVGPYAFNLWINLISGEASILVYYYRRGGLPLGTIRGDRFYPNEQWFNKTRDFDAIKKFLEHPRQAAAAAASTTTAPTCACCNRRLGRSDLSRGIGQSCWDAWDFSGVGEMAEPHGEGHASRRARKRRAARIPSRK